MAQVLRRDVDRLSQHLKKRLCKTQSLHIHTQNQKKKNEWYMYITWTSLWIWRPMISLEGIPENTLRSSIVKASCALIKAKPASSQTLDDREPTFSLPLSATRCLFGQGVISSTEVAGEVALVVLGTKLIGWSKFPSRPLLPPSSPNSRGAHSS